VEFSRLDQFQAVLVGVAVADAAAHGQIPSISPVVPQRSPVPQASASWCHALGQVAHQITVPGRADHAGMEGYSAVEGAIIQLPLLLRYLDTPGAPAIARLELSAFDDFLIVQLYALLQKLLCVQQQSLSLRLQALQARRDQLPQHPDAVLLVRAIQATLNAAGDFRLAIAALPTATSPLQPVLIGLLCTALRGLKTVPVSWRQALGLPQLSPWYVNRWGIADERELRDIAIDLWCAWAGL
jgi:hypothetical protein